MKNLLLTALCTLLFAGAFSQSEDSVFIRRIADEVLLNGKAYDDLRVLTKQIGGRLSGSPQMVKAEQWGLRTIQSAGPDKAWLQECMVPHWVRGGKDEVYASFNPGEKQKINKGTLRNLDVIALGNSLGTGKS